MSDCSNVAKCSFFDIEAKDRAQHFALQGFMKLYCKGHKQDQCVRRFVGRSLGGPDKIPFNMMPNGLPLSGSDDSNWSPEVKTLLARERDSIQQRDSGSCSQPIKPKVAP